MREGLLSVITVIRCYESQNGTGQILPQVDHLISLLCATRYHTAAVVIIEIHHATVIDDTVVDMVQV